ncbi:MAG: sigma 54-interacting transcriptional regulator [Acidobacteriota bacterium]|jgi:DNA-binding NtrC family response regulator
MASAALRIMDYCWHEGLLESITQPAVLVRCDHRILRANQAYSDRFADGEDVRGRLCYQVSHSFSRPCRHVGVSCPLTQAITTGRCSRSLHLHRAEGGYRQDEISYFPLKGADGRVAAVLEIICPHCREADCNQADAQLVGNSAAFHAMMGLVEQVARTDAPVLLLGESGTGKELAAKAVHRLSRRAAGRFISVACTEIAESLLESELFGHEKGSFTGASGSKVGLIEASHGGTLFLDEIGDMPVPLQIKLLRVLDRGRYRRVGSTSERESDFRLVCATHRNLHRMVDDGRFRHDLYFRINAFPIRVPPLRERFEDLPLLVDALRHRLDCGDGCRPGDGTMEALAGYSFPGNVRELFNILQRACLLSGGDTIEPSHLPGEVNGDSPGSTGLSVSGVVPLAEVEARYLRWAAATFGGTRQELAKQLGLSERSLYRKLRGVLQPGRS